MRASARDDEDELDFRLTFGEELGEPRPSAVVSDLDIDEAPAYPMGPCLAVNQPIGIPRRRGPTGRAGMHSPPPRPVTDGDTYESQPARLIHLGGSKVLACPSIQITSISPTACDREEGGGEEAEVADEDEEEAWGLVEAAVRERPYLPPDPFGYRGGSLSASPGSSCRSSPGIWPSGAGSPFSSSSSPSSWTPFDDVEPELREAAYRMALAPLPSPGSARWAGDEASSCSASSPSPSSTSPVADDPLRLSPRGPGSGPPSRPTSPCGKRRHSGFEAYSYHQEQPYYQQRGHPSPGRSPSPSRKGTFAIDDEAPPSREGPPSPLLLLHHLLLPPPPPPAYQRGASVPVKARRTSQAQRVAPLRQGEGEGEPGGVPYAGTEALAQLQTLKKDAASMEYLTVPSPFVWTKARTAGHSPVFRSSALPPLDWPLPSQYEQLELQMEVQPRTHHRAHYETEGSRGAVKAAAGGHPVVKLQGYTEKPLTLQMFIGTADERNLRPHPFYHIHRITGKMVSTASQEAMVGTTKILEVPLLPENNMTANIDCAGILKLRNSDIELRKGETDIGRKNTRVKLVFRVYVPQANGRVVSLQVASVPIECSQRSAHELPHVDSVNPLAYPVIGGGDLLLTGWNFLPDSKVLFMEKAPDGRPLWEVQAKVDRARSTESLIVAEVPPYHEQTLSAPAQVCFLVCNGKRKRSPCLSFQYLPVHIKTEDASEEFEPRDPSLCRHPAEYPLPPGGGLLEARDLGPVPLPGDEVEAAGLSAFPRHPLGLGPGPEAYSPRTDARGQQPEAYGLRPDAYGKSPEAYSPRPEAYSMGPEVSSPRPEAYGQEPEAYGKGPEAYGPACMLEAHEGLFQPSRPSAPGQPIAGSDGCLFPWDPHPHCSPCSPHRAGGRAGLVSRSPGTGCGGEKRERATMTEEEEEIHDCEVPFRTISIQGITLDDVNEIIGRDLSEIPRTVGVDRADDAP